MDRRENRKSSSSTQPSGGGKESSRKSFRFLFIVNEAKLLNTNITMKEDYCDKFFKFYYENLEAQQRQSKKCLFLVTTENEDINVVAENIVQVANRYPEAHIIEKLEEDVNVI